MPLDERRQRNLKNLCARTTCQANMRDNRWWNNSSLVWYCEYCAKLINTYNMTGKPLCVPESEAQKNEEAWIIRHVVESLKEMNDKEK